MTNDDVGSRSLVDVMVTTKLVEDDGVLLHGDGEVELLRVVFIYLLFEPTVIAVCPEDGDSGLSLRMPFLLCGSIDGATSAPCPSSRSRR